MLLKYLSMISNYKIIMKINVNLKKLSSTNIVTVENCKRREREKKKNICLQEVIPEVTEIMILQLWKKKYTLLLTLHILL